MSPKGGHASTVEKTENQTWLHRSLYLAVGSTRASDLFLQLGNEKHFYLLERQEQVPPSVWVLQEADSRQN